MLAGLLEDVDGETKESRAKVLEVGQELAESNTESL